MEWQLPTRGTLVYSHTWVDYEGTTVQVLASTSLIEAGAQ